MFEDCHLRTRLNWNARSVDGQESHLSAGGSSRGEAWVGSDTHWRRPRGVIRPTVRAARTKLGSVGGTARLSNCDELSSTVTRLPSAIEVAATSSPTNPPPARSSPVPPLVLHAIAAYHRHRKGSLCRVPVECEELLANSFRQLEQAWPTAARTLTGRPVVRQTSFPAN